jgi:hypothetical protein
VNRIFLKDGYVVVNLILIGVILAVIAYSFLFHPENNKYPIPSGSALAGNQSTISTGLSHSFSEIVRFRFTRAKSFNPYGIRVFSFFIFQLLLRAGGIMVMLRPTGIKHRDQIIRVDILLSVVLFLILFRPFFEALLAQLFQ